MHFFVVALFFLVVSGTAEGQQLSKVVLPRQGDTLQANFYAMECNGDTCAVVTSGYNWSSHTAKLFLEVSTDQGDSWMRRELPIPIQKDELLERKPRAICFRGSDIWIVGDSGLMMVGANLGETWHDRSTNDWRGLRFLDFKGNVGVALGIAARGLITKDGGASWDTIPGLPVEQFYSSRILSQDSLLLWGSKQRMYSWTDGRVTDTLFQLSSDAENLHAVRKLLWKDDKEVIAVVFHQRRFPGQEPAFVNSTQVATSRDGGRTFSTIFDDSISVVDPYDASINSFGVGMIVGLGREILRTSDWGETWTWDSITANVGYDKFPRVSMISSTEALLQASNFAQGVILKTRFEKARVHVIGERERIGTYLFPNPSNGMIHLQKWYEYDGDVRLIDSYGRESARMHINREPGVSTIDCSVLPSGTYTVTMNSHGVDFPAGRFILMK